MARFIHVLVDVQVRTPLNALCMGLELLQTEITEALGYCSPREAPSETACDDTQPRETAAKLAACRFDIDRTQIQEWMGLTKELEATAQSAVGVLNDFLCYDKVENGTLTLEYSIVPIWRLIAKNVDEFKVPASQKNIALEAYFVDPNSTTSDGDEENVTGQISFSNYENLPDEARGLSVVGDSIRITQVCR